MSESRSMDEHELDKLLPWYVNGTLEGEERRAVEDYVARSQHARDQVALLSRIREAVREEQPGSPGAFGLARLRAAMNETRPSPAPREGATRWRMVAAAAGVVVMVQAGLLFNRWQEPPAYQPLGTGDGAALLVSFSDRATAADIQALLNDIDATIRSGPGSLGLYRLELGEGVDEAEALSILRAASGVVDEARRD